jgi:hypothetical protein
MGVYTARHSLWSFIIVIPMGNTAEPKSLGYKQDATKISAARKPWERSFIFIELKFLKFQGSFFIEFLETYLLMNADILGTNLKWKYILTMLNIS